MNNLDYFNQHGFVLLKKVIPPDFVSLAQEIGDHIYPDHMAQLGEPKTFGSTHHWKTMDMYTTKYPKLLSMMTSEFMADIVKTYLGPEAYLFNEQFVFKAPREDWAFPWHCDNFYGPDPEGGLAEDYKAITTCWFLTKNDSSCGGISFLSKENTTMEDLINNAPISKKPEIAVSAEPGDMGVWTGSSLHYSVGNNSDLRRNLWLQVYSSKPLGEGFKNGYHYQQFLSNGTRIL